ncbi:Sodium hydrogen exchanger [Musa troglodytarum]|uniref:Sodium hydrogen exchanger n=1 Tax=Musa troglodytarum TaxID=320322 RepID=A0A9E7KXI0_9LILI|nr:Sodium hydrogen exchanger [Musa troglodytarum]
MALGWGAVMMKLGLSRLEASDHASVVSINIFVTLICACIVIGHLLEENRWMNESITALIIGLCTGFVIRLATRGKNNSHIMVFSEDLFFIYVLPPIIFNAGYVLQCYIGSTCFFCYPHTAIGAIFSATDSVCTLQVLNQDETPLLYSLVFGEGVVNDATSVVLFNALQNFDLFTRSGHTQQRGNAFMITSTITVVLFSTMVFGLMTKPLIYFLLPPSSKHLTRSLSVSSEPSSPKSFLSPLLGNGQGSELEATQCIPHPTNLRMLLTTPSRSVHHYWRKFDDAFMRPVFGGRGFVPFVPGSPVERSVPEQE